MIQTNTILNVSDNSGVKTVMCIKVAKGFKNSFSKIGDVITVSIKTLRKKRKINSTVSKGDICRALIIRCKTNSSNIYGEKNIFLENSVVLFTKQNKFLFSRVFGVVPNIIRSTKYTRILSLSGGILI